MGMTTVTTDKTVSVHAMNAYSGSRLRAVIRRQKHGW